MCAETIPCGQGQRPAGERGQLRDDPARLADDNAKLDRCDRVTIDSIRNHTTRHFPVQNVAKATYRRILERRAQENGVDFVEGVATAITPMAFYETVMVKGYETLVDSGTWVDVNTGMIAAGRLQALIDSRAGGTRIADLMVQMGRIIDAVPPASRKSCGRRSCARSMDLWRLIHRRMSWKTVTKRTSTTPRNPRSRRTVTGCRATPPRWGLKVCEIKAAVAVDGYGDASSREGF